MPETLVSIEGGVDLRTSSINSPKGSLTNCLNFEKDQGAGLVRRLGWTRYDGRVSGPEIDDAVICFYNSANKTGVFLYGEQVTIFSAGRPTLNAIFIGDAAPTGSFPSALALAYPIQTFTDWTDVTAYPNATVITGVSSGAQVTVLTGPPVLMNVSDITIPWYDNIKNVIQLAHSASVGKVPGRNESPIDAEFTYGNNSYAIHDCVTYTFTDGMGTTVFPLEGHHLVDRASGNQLGIILSVRLTSGDWTAGDAAGQFVVYDYPLGQSFPSIGDQVDLYSADGTTKLVNAVCLFGTTASTSADPNNTRALLYETYEQYVKNQSYAKAYGAQIIDPPKWQVPSPPTWTRPRITRELPYYLSATGSPAGFGPKGQLDYSIYEYSRQGLTANIQLLDPVNTGEVFPTVAATPGGWVNPNNILVQDGAVATWTSSAAAGQVTSFLSGNTFNFASIPDDSTILGVVVRLRADGNAAGTNGWIDSEVRLTSSAFPNGIGSQNKANGFILPGVLTDRTYGGSTDAWGEQLTTAIIKDPSFGVAVRWRKLNGTIASAVQVDAYAITVYYTPTTRTVWIRDPTIVAAPAQDVAANIIHYCVDTGDASFVVKDAVGVLTVVIGTSEYQGTAAGKIRRLKAGDEIRTGPSNPATNAATGDLLAYVGAEDYPSTFPPGAAIDANISRYEVIDANFWDVPEGRAAYIANGAEYATMWDGTFTVRIRTGRPAISDNPRHLAAHLGYLHLGFAAGAVVNTATGKPLTVVGAIGAAVYNFGEPITGMLTLNGQTLGVWTDRSTRGLQGNSPTTAGGGSGYTPMMISPAINCIEYTLVNLVGQAVWTSYRGVETVRTVNAYGDFETLPLSAAAQLWLQGRLQADLAIGSRPSRALYAIGVRNKRQYRLYFADGYVYTLTMFDAGDQPVSTFQRVERPNSMTTGTVPNTFPTNAGVIRHIYSGTLSDGKEVILASFENQNSTVVTTGITPYFPYVVKIDSGYADDVASYMPCFMELAAIYPAYPTIDNQWQSATVFVNAYGGSQLTLYTRVKFDAPIIDFTFFEEIIKSDDPDVRSETQVLPLIEYRAYIPVPQRYLKFDTQAEGRMLKLLIDGTQKPALLNPALVPVRITHISLTTSDPLTTDKT